jgi:hypothetical protein
MFLTLCRWLANVRALRSSQVQARLARRTRRRPGPRWIHLEQLEERAVPAVVTFSVTSLADSGPGTLRDAIVQADGGAASNSYVINIEKAGAITLESALPDLSRDITIHGLGSGNSTVQRDPSAVGFGIFRVDAGETVSLSGLAIARGDSGGSGGGLDNFGTVTVRDSLFTGNTAVSGGGLENETGGTATVSDSAFTGNSATLLGEGAGGGLGNSGTVTVSDTLFTGNNSSAGSGGGLDNNGTATVSGSTFIGNSAALDGGALDNDGTATVSDSTFTGNSAVFGGGLENDGTATVSDSTFTRNSATKFGGGLDNFGTVTVSGSTFTGNSAGIDGGGIFNGGALTQSGNTIIGNSPDDLS